MDHRKEIMTLPEDERLDYALALIDILTGKQGHGVGWLQTQYELTDKEAQILYILNLRAGNTVTREALFESVYGGLADVGVKILDVFVCKLRNKLKKLEDGPIVKTIWGTGYMLMNPIEIPEAEALDLEVKIVQRLPEDPNKTGSRWTHEEHKQLMQFCIDNVPIRDMAIILMRSERAILTRIYDKGIRKTIKKLKAEQQK